MRFCQSVVAIASFQISQCFCICSVFFLESLVEIWPHVLSDKHSLFVFYLHSAGVVALTRICLNKVVFFHSCLKT